MTMQQWRFSHNDQQVNKLATQNSFTVSQPNTIRSPHHNMASPPQLIPMCDAHSLPQMKTSRQKLHFVMSFIL